METVKKTKWELRWEKQREYRENERLRFEKIQENIKKKKEEKERKEIEKETKIEEVKTLNRLAIEEYCNREGYQKSENEYNFILSKTEIEQLVRYAYKRYREILERDSFYIIRRESMMGKPIFTYFKDLDRIDLFERYLTVNPPIYKLDDLREYLKGNRKHNKILTIILNQFDDIRCCKELKVFSGSVYTYAYSVLHNLIKERTLLIAYIDKLKSENIDRGNFLKWNLQESKIIKLYSQFIDNAIINESVSLGAFYQIFNNQLATFENPIQIEPMNLACFLFWSRDKEILTNKQPFKIIERLGMFCNAEGKLITAHNLNRYLSEYKDDFLECTKPIYSKIKEIFENL